MVRFSKFFCLVKACENRHWFLFHRRLPIFHRMAARGRRSDEGPSRQNFHAKNEIWQFLSHINVIYLKRTHFSSRIQIQTKKYGSLLKNLKKNYFQFWVKTKVTRCLRWLISWIFWQQNSKMALPGVVKRFELKSHQIWAHYLQPVRNGRRLSPRGGSRSPPPKPIRVYLSTSVHYEKAGLAA